MSGVDVSMNGIELQDREFVAAIREQREPNASVAQVLPCYEVLDRLERSFMSRQSPVPAIERDMNGFHVCVISDSRRQISMRITAEPTNANQNGAVTPQICASTPPTAAPTTSPPCSPTM